MAVNYVVQAQMVGLRTDTPRPADRCFVDTNVWFWTVYSNARISICVQACFFTSAPIAKALVDAHKRRVKVQVILDKSQRTEKYSSADFLHNSGIPTFIDAEHAIAHNKIIVIDGHVVITGSFNFTKAAEQSNAENLLVIDDPGLAERYAKNWQQHLQHSPPYAGRLPSKR